jgi:hypothetical protein
MATFNMGWIDEEEAIMGVGSRPVLCAEVLREEPKNTPGKPGDDNILHFSPYAHPLHPD